MPMRGGMSRRRSFYFGQLRRGSGTVACVRGDGRDLDATYPAFRAFVRCGSEMLRGDRGSDPQTRWKRTPICYTGIHRGFIIMMILGRRVRVDLFKLPE